MCWMCFEPPATSLAKPPVAMTLASEPNSAFVRERTPSTEIYRTVIEASLHLLDGVAADNFPRILDFDAEEPRGSAEECIRRDTDSGNDRAAEVFATRRNDVDCGGRAEIHHDARAAVFLKRRDAVHDAVRAHLKRVVNQHGHSCLNPRLDEQGLAAEIMLRHSGERRVQGRYNRTDNHAADFVGL